jgi:hypothetical protein
MATVLGTIAAPARIHVVGDPFAAAGTKCAEQLHASSFNEFVVNDRETNVTVFEVTGSPESDRAVQKTVFRSTQGIVEHCRAILEPSLRVMYVGVPRNK